MFSGWTFSYTSFLSWQEALNARACGRRWKRAAALAPVAELDVRHRDVGLDLPRIAGALPSVRSFRIDFGTSRTREFEIQDGDEAEPTLQFAMADYTPPPEVDLEPIRRFAGLRHLALRQTRLNGKYPYIFQFKNLVSLDLLWNTRLKWDLELLAGLPNLQRLCCPQNHSLTGDLSSVRVLRGTLTELKLLYCHNVTGELHDVYDLPLLETLDVSGTSVVGDIRTIGPDDFPVLKKLGLGDGVYGGGKMQRINEASSLMEARYQLMKRIPDVFKQKRWNLADDSPDRYDVRGHHSREPPFLVEFVKIGLRMGWRWTNAVCGGCCEINWLDPEPRPSDEEYSDYRRKLEDEERREVGFFRGFHKPPTEAEYEERAAEVPLDPIHARFGTGRMWRDW